MIIKQLQVSLALFWAILIVGCAVPPYMPSTNQLPAPTSSSVRDMISAIESQPKWLPDPKTCPVAVMSEREISSNYSPDKCKNNLGHCLESCRQNNGEDCYALAVQVDKAFIDREPHSIGVSLHLKACELGITSGCTNAAASRLVLPETSDDVGFCAFDTFERACDRDDPWGCTMYGQRIIEKKGRFREAANARMVLRKSCKFGDEDEACTTAKQLLEVLSDAENQANSK